jgi:copper chaperone CopZ
MEKISLKLPAMYGDHHVTDVRRILLELPGVCNIFASSAFQTVDVQFDLSQVNGDQIKAALEKAGYLGDLPLTGEPSTASVQGQGNSDHFRHTISYIQTKQVVSFSQTVNYKGRPLWPCPGMGPIKNIEAE